MRCGEEIELFTSSLMWAVWVEEEYLSHHTRRKFNFYRLLYIIFSMTQIHRVRFVSVNGEASRGIDFFQNFFRIFFFNIRIRISISLWISFEKVILYILKRDTKFGVAPQSFCENQNTVQDQDQDHYFTLDFNTRPIPYIENAYQILFRSANFFKSYCVHSKSPRTARQTDKQTEFFLFVLSSKTYCEQVCCGVKLKTQYEYKLRMECNNKSSGKSDTHAHW